MTDNLIIGFWNDARTISIPPDIIKQYPLSPIYGYWIENPNDTIMIQDICYADFCIIAQVIQGHIKQYHVSKQIKEYLHHYGFINDVLYEIECALDKTCHKMESFLEYPDNIFLTTAEEYPFYKKLFHDKKHIIPIQVIYRIDCSNNSDIDCISIYDGLPIYYGNSIYEKKAHTLEQHVSISNSIDIKYARKKMFFSKFRDIVIPGDPYIFLTKNEIVEKQSILSGIFDNDDITYNMNVMKLIQDHLSDNYHWIMQHEHIKHDYESKFIDFNGKIVDIVISLVQKNEALFRSYYDRSLLVPTCDGTSNHYAYLLHLNLGFIHIAI